MTSSPRPASYYFWFHRRKPAEVKEVFPVPRLRKCDQVTERNMTGNGLRFKGHVQRRHGWSKGDHLSWPVIGQSVLVCLLAVIGQCGTTAAESGGDLQRVSVIRLGNCRALVNHNIIDLHRLSRRNVSLRYVISHYR